MFILPASNSAILGWVSSSTTDSLWYHGWVLTAHLHGHIQFEQLGCKPPLFGKSMKLWLLWGQTCSNMFCRTNKTKETFPQLTINHILWYQEFWRRILSTCWVTKTNYTGCFLAVVHYFYGKPIEIMKFSSFQHEKDETHCTVVYL